MNFTDDDDGSDPVPIPPPLLLSPPAAHSEAAGGIGGNATASAAEGGEQQHQNQCVDLNEVLWESSRDPTTRPEVAALFALFYTYERAFFFVLNILIIIKCLRRFNF
jgi:hypothetical protein